ncbi:MAG TPA: trypsin-like peptidase domain-containing protein [Candidatus Saccharimonadales bacterium]|nr:trypsin-like peptidase domain-containing protein [Candidatus Saccharimonadales bacterium]
MAEPEISKEPAALPEPLKEENKTVKSAATTPKNTVWSRLGMVLLCFVASFLGAWVLLATGLVRPDVSRTITDNKQTLVLQQGEIVAEVFKRVNPSTVTITAQTIDTSRRFFAPQVTEGSGTGIIISKDGYILTNKHVVPQGTDKVTVVTSDGKQYTDVKVVGRDPSNDIAFLKINGVTNVTPAELGDSSAVEPGQQVVAIGNALGLFRNSVTSGIISGIGRPVLAGDEDGASSEQLEDMFQTDAAINPGNSGGPLVNLKGQVIGMNTAVSASGQSIGFAIPINTAKGLIDSVTKDGKVSKAYLGVSYVTIDQDIAAQLKLPVSSGALLRSGGDNPAVALGSPAAQAGLKEGDIITKINDKPVAQGAGLVTQLSQFKPGTQVTLVVIRDGKEQTVKVTLGTFPQS